MTGFATIGSNFIVERFLQAAKLCDGFALEAVFSRNLQKAQQLAAQWGADKAYASLEALAADPAVQAVYIASPNVCHAPQTELLLRAGKHVLCEKPVTCTLAELQHLQKTARENGVVLLEAIRLAHNPAYDVFRTSLPQLGPIRRAILNYCQYSSRYDKFRSGMVENAFDPTLGNGALMDIGVYCVHAMVMLFGKPDSLHAEGWFLPRSIDAAGSVLARYKDMSVHLSYSKVNNSFLPCEIQGEKGCLQFEPLAAPTSARIIWNGGEVQDISLPSQQDDMQHQIRRFLSLIDGAPGGETFSQYSHDTLAIMDEIRAQVGIDFQVHDKQ